MKSFANACILSWVFIGIVLGGYASVAFSEIRTSDPYTLQVFPREDSRQKDAETGVDLLYLSNGKSKDINLYFHQRSWLFDGSLVLFTSAREQGGLMGYIVETGELVRITAADGRPTGRATAATGRNSVFAMADDDLLEIALTITVSGEGDARHAAVTAVERRLNTIPGVDTYINESCDARYIAASGAALVDGKAGIKLIRESDGAVETLCALPEGLTYAGHLQWSITNPNWLSFAAHPQRLWVVDIRDKTPFCPYRQKEGELITHESWWVEDQMMFCGGEHTNPGEQSSLKVLNVRTGVVRIVGEGSWMADSSPDEVAHRNWWHASGSADGYWAAGDNWHGDIMLFEGMTTRPRLLTTGHRTFGSKGAHPEVGWDRKGEQVIFGSNRLGEPVPCIATIPPAWNEEVRQMGGHMTEVPPLPEGCVVKGDRFIKAPAENR